MSPAKTFPKFVQLIFAPLELTCKIYFSLLNIVAFAF